MNFPTVDILGFSVARLNMEQVIDQIATAIKNKDSQSKQSFHIVTANAEILYRAYAEPELGQLLQQADLITPDGKGAVQASQRLGQPVPERVTGIDLIWKLLPRAEQEGWRIYFLGASNSVAKETVKVVHQKWPKLKIAGWHNGFFSEAERPDIIEKVLEARADIVFVALGFPAQDQLIIEMIKTNINTKTKAIPTVSIGVGGSFDAISGNVKRAPQWIQKLGLEWAYRFAQNPKRLNRAMALPKFVLAVRKQAKQAKKAKKHNQR